MHYNHDGRKIGAQNAEEIIDIANNYHETEENIVSRLRKYTLAQSQGVMVFNATLFQVYHGGCINPNIYFYILNKIDLYL